MSARAQGERSRVPVLFIGGTGRCGSTLLDRFLGQYSGVFAAGEVFHLWTHALQGGRCGCGEYLTECETWRAVFDEAFGGMDDALVAEFLRLGKRARTRFLPLASTHRSWDLWLRWLGPYPEWLERLYHAISVVTGCDLVVDASKDPVHAFILNSRPGVEVRMVHLVRDPRAAAFSWLRKKSDPGRDGEQFMKSAGVAHSTSLWVALNQACSSFGRRNPDRYMVLRYEDFVMSPHVALERIGSHVGRELDDRPFVGQRTLRLDPTHSAWGNANRFERGTFELQLDDEWRTAMRPIDRWVVTSMTSLQLRRYGYPVLAGRTVNGTVG